ncbi:MAG: hypothetical protein EBY07_14960 [Actinobacteria bacterium]|nr:hypothetical protein [Actinomycetota bacterium]
MVEEVVEQNIVHQVVMVVLVSSFSNIQNQFHHLSTQQTLGSFVDHHLGLHQLEFQMLTI